jgi:hypothetical protein
VLNVILSPLFVWLKQIEYAETKIAKITIINFNSILAMKPPFIKDATSMGSSKNITYGNQLVNDISLPLL